MTENPKPTGTEGATPQAPQSGTADGAPQGGAGEDKVEVSKVAWEQHLREKSNRERERQELEELRARVEQGGKPTHDSADADAAAKYQAYLELKNSSHPQDRLIAEMIEDKERTARRMEYRLELLEVPKEDRTEVERVSKQNRVMPSLAHKLIEAERLKQKEQTLLERERQMEERERLKAQGVVATTATPIPTHETNNGTMTSREYSKKVNDLIAQGRKDQARDLMRKREHGQLVIKDD